MSDNEQLPTLATERFQLVREIGRGGMGVVYEAVERATGAHVALKLLPKADAETLLSFKREFRTVSELLHPNLVAPYELVAEGEQWFFTMELVRGVDLLQWVRNGRVTDDVIAGASHPSFAQLVEDQRLRDALRQLAIGVRTLHNAGLLHRDLKPSNVLVRPDGHVAILDFGLSVEVIERLSTSEHSAGTLAYMAPEQLAGESLGSASDWYAVGVMLYEALTGRQPFGSNMRQVMFAKMTGSYDAPASLVADIPEELAILCAELLASEPADRATDAEVLARIGAAGAGVGAGTSANEALRIAATAVRPSSPPFVGREFELKRLEACHRRAADGATGIALVHGRSGAGKSALLQHFLQEYRADPDTLLLAGKCYEQESVPFKAIDTIVDSLTRWLMRSEYDMVRSILPEDLDALVRVFPVLARVNAVSGGLGARLAIPDPRELRRRAFRALRSLLANIGAHAQLILSIDDLQWGDADSAELLVSLLTHQSEQPLRLLFVASYRSEYRKSSVCLQLLADALLSGSEERGVTEIEVAPFESATAHALALSMLDGNDSDAAAARIAKESGGNPFFIGELCRYANENPTWLSQSAGGFDLDQVLWQRVSRLPAAARQVLETIAVAGQPIRNLYWRDAIESDARDPQTLALLRHDRLIRSTGVAADDEVETYHDRIRATVVAHLSDDARRTRHHALAEAHERKGGGDPETIANHFVSGGEPSRAWMHYAEAARGAARALAFERAANLFARAIEHHVGTEAEGLELLELLGNAHSNAGRGRDAASAYEAAAERTTNADARLDLLRLAASQYCLSGAIDLGRTRFREVLRGVGLRPAESSIGILAQLMARRTRLRIRGLSFTPRAESAVPKALLRRLDTLWAASTGLSSVDVVGVAALQSQALLLALEAGEPKRLALALAWEAVLTATSGTSAAPRAAELLRLGRSLAARTNDPQTLGMIQLSEGWVAFLHTRFDEALETVAVAERIFAEQCVGVWWELLLSRTLLAWGMAHTGRIQELRAAIRQWEPEARARGDYFIVTNLLAYAMPHERMLSDDVAAARAHLREALELWPYEGFHLQHVSVLFSEGMLAIYEGDGATACAIISARWRAMVSSLQTQNQQTRVMLRDVRARGALLAAAQGIDVKKHRKRVERDIGAHLREKAEWATGSALRLKAGLALLDGDRVRAAALLRDAIPRLEASGLTMHCAAMRRRLGQLSGGAEGAALVSEAEELMRSRGVVNVEAVTRLFGIP